KRCRFVVASRPLDWIPDSVSTFQLRPLNSEVVSVLLPSYGLEPVRERQVRQQLQSFSNHPIDPLLFTIVLKESSKGNDTKTRAQLFESYFRSLLRVEEDKYQWFGWSSALEFVAQWFLLDTGQRGVGLPPDPLMERMEKMEGESAQPTGLAERLRNR